jgi:hypothetical protein
MTSKDFAILGKKILVGIIIYFIPVLIISSGLYLTNRFLKNNSAIPDTTINNVKP